MRNKMGRQAKKRSGQAGLPSIAGSGWRLSHQRIQEMNEVESAEPENLLEADSRLQLGG